MSNVNMNGLNLDLRNLRGKDLSSADLSGINLSDADLRGADLSSADLSGTNLRGADLRGADLSGADLRGANLHGADLRGTDLSDVALCGVNLSGTKFGIEITKKYLIEKLMEHVHSNRYNQSNWCGTNCCVAGYAGELVGNQTAGVLVIAQIIPEFNLSVLYKTNPDVVIAELNRVIALKM